MALKCHLVPQSTQHCQWYLISFQFVFFMQYFDEILLMKCKKTVETQIGCYIPPLSMHLFIPRSETVSDARLLISHYQLCACVAKNLIPLFNRNAGGTARGSPHLQQNNGSICRCLASTKEKCWKMLYPQVHNVSSTPIGYQLRQNRLIILMNDPS